MDPIAFEPSEPLMKDQFGFPSSALSVFQMPPPAAPTYSRHLLLLQDGSSAIALTRPEAM